MRTNIILLLALVIFLVGFFSSQVSLTGNYSRSDYYTSLTNDELARLGSLNLDKCRDIARFAAYGYDSRHYAQVADPDPNPSIRSRYQFTSNTYPAFDITGDGTVDTDDVELCYDSVRQVNAFENSPRMGQSPIAATSIARCSPEGRELCRYGKLYVCSRDQYGVLTYAEASQQPTAGDGCHSGLGIISRVVGKQPSGQSFLFTAP